MSIDFLQATKAVHDDHWWSIITVFVETMFHIESIQPLKKCTYPKACVCVWWRVLYVNQIVPWAIQPACSILFEIQNRCFVKFIPWEATEHNTRYMLVASSTTVTLVARRLSSIRAGAHCVVLSAGKTCHQCIHGFSGRQKGSLSLFFLFFLHYHF